MQILIVEDDLEVREMIAKILRTEGFQCTETSNGKEAIQALKNTSEFDLVITDIIMPEKEGLETIREIRQNYPTTRILAISGGGKGKAQDYLVIAKSMGADLTLNKPFVRQDLLYAVGQLAI